MFTNFIFRNVEKIGVILFVFSYGKLHLRLCFFSTIRKLSCIANHAKSD